jgi:hypothetical protein
MVEEKVLMKVVLKEKLWVEKKEHDKAAKLVELTVHVKVAYSVS